MEKQYDIVIIGAGVAGLSTAAFLKDSGLKIALIDRKKDLLNLSFFTLGSFLDYKKYGFSDKVVASKLDNCWLYSNHFKVLKSIDSNLPANILDKKQIHTELLERILNNKNIDIYSRLSVKQVSIMDDQIESVTLSDNQVIKGRIFVDSSGITGVLSKKMGLMPKQTAICTGLEYNVEYSGNPNTAYLMYGSYYAGGYGWIFPLGNKRAIFGIGSFNLKVKSELKQRLNKLLESDDFKNIVKKDNDNAQGGTIPLTDVIKTFVKGNLICVGDSVSNVNPLVGEGYRFIIEAAELASKYIHQSVKENSLEILMKYQQDWSSKFESNYIHAKKLQNIADFGSRHGFIADLLVLFLKTKSTKTVTRLMASEITRKDLYLP